MFFLRKWMQLFNIKTPQFETEIVKNPFFANFSHFYSIFVKNFHSIRRIKCEDVKPEKNHCPVVSYEEVNKFIDRKVTEIDTRNYKNPEQSSVCLFRTICVQFPRVFMG